MTEAEKFIASIQDDRAEMDRHRALAADAQARIVNKGHRAYDAFLASRRATRPRCEMSADRRASIEATLRSNMKARTDEMTTRCEENRWNRCGKPDSTCETHRPTDAGAALGAIQGV